MPEIQKRPLFSHSLFLNAVRKMKSHSNNTFIYTTTSLFVMHKGALSQTCPQLCSQQLLHRESDVHALVLMLFSEQVLHFECSLLLNACDQFCL